MPRDSGPTGAVAKVSAPEPTSRNAGQNGAPPRWPQSSSPPPGAIGAGFPARRNESAESGVRWTVLSRH